MVEIPKLEFFIHENINNPIFRYLEVLNHWPFQVHHETGFDHQLFVIFDLYYLMGIIIFCFNKFIAKLTSPTFTFDYCSNNKNFLPRDCFYEALKKIMQMEYREI